MFRSPIAARKDGKKTEVNIYNLSDKIDNGNRGEKQL